MIFSDLNDLNDLLDLDSDLNDLIIQDLLDNLSYSSFAFHNHYTEIDLRCSQITTSRLQKDTSGQNIFGSFFN